MSKTNKGTPYEREISVALSYWWTEGLRDDIFWRSKTSGGRATTRAKRGKGTANSDADITFLDPIGEPLIRKCCLELKRGYGTWSVMDVLDKGPKMKPQTFEQFVDQVKRDAERESKEPIIIFKKDKRQSCIAVRRSLVSRIVDQYGMPPKPRIIVYYENEAWNVFRLEDFFDWCDPDFFKRIM